MPYRIAGIDVHKKMLAVVVSDVEIESEYQFERRMFSSNPEQLRSFGCVARRAKGRRNSHGVDGAILETRVGNTGEVLEAALREAGRSQAEVRQALHLAQALSNRGRRGRKRDFVDAERLVKRLVARELTLSFVPDAEQRLWRTVTRKKYQLRRDVVRLNNQLESLLEEAHIKFVPAWSPICLASVPDAC